MNKKFLLRFIILCFLALTACAKEVYANPQIQASTIPQEQTDLNSSDISDVKEIADDNAAQEDSMAESDVLPIENPAEEPDLTVTLPETSPEPTGIVWEPFDENTRVEAVIDGESVSFTQQEAMDYVMSGKILTVHDGAVFDFDGDGKLEQIHIVFDNRILEKMQYHLELSELSGMTMDLSYDDVSVCCAMSKLKEDICVGIVSLDKRDIVILLSDWQTTTTDCWEENIFVCRICNKNLEFVGCFDSTFEDFVLKDGVYEAGCFSFANILNGARLQMDISYMDGTLYRDNFALNPIRDTLTLVSDLYAYSDENEESVKCFEAGHKLQFKKLIINNLDPVIEEVSNRRFVWVGTYIQGTAFFTDLDNGTDGIVYFEGGKILPVSDKDGISYSNDQYWMFEEIKPWVG